MPPAKKKSAATASSVADTVTTIKEASPIIKRKEYYLVSTSIHFPDAKGDDIKFVETNTQPQLFSNERKAKDYLKHGKEELTEGVSKVNYAVKTGLNGNQEERNTKKDNSTGYKNTYNEDRTKNKKQTL